MQTTIRRDQDNIQHEKEFRKLKDSNVTFNSHPRKKILKLLRLERQSRNKSE